jgi:hypothetical protein
MLIPINEKYRITSDERNVIIEERRVSGSTGKKVKNPGEEYWVPMSFHPNLEYAIKWLLQREIRLSDALGIYALMDCIKDLETSVLQALTSLEHGQRV